MVKSRKQQLVYHWNVRSNVTRLRSVWGSSLREAQWLQRLQLLALQQVSCGPVPAFQAYGVHSDSSNIMLLTNDNVMQICTSTCSIKLELFEQRDYQLLTSSTETRKLCTELARVPLMAYSLAPGPGQQLTQLVVSVLLPAPTSQQSACLSADTVYQK